MEETRGGVLESRAIYKGRIFNVNVDRVRMPNGHEVNLEVVRHGGSVVLIPVPDPDHVILVRQYRYAIDRWIWELPAGTLNPGESPESGAARECEEEIGLIPSRLDRIGTFYPTPGFCDEAMNLFRVSGLRPPAPGAVRAEQDEDEDLRVQAFDVHDAFEMVRRGEIVDLKTAFGLQLLGSAL
jgi:ADP-ribose pyrophosphatase